MILDIPDLGSGSFYHQANDSHCFVTSLNFLSLKNDVNVASKSNKQNDLGKKKFVVAVLEVTDKMSRIRIRKSQVWIRITVLWLKFPSTLVIFL